jgi:hypothetical protein
MADEKQQNISWSWKNYFQPTPRFFLRIAEYLKGAFVLVSSAAIWESVQTENATLGIVTVVVGYTLDQAIKFFGQVEAEEKEKREREIKVTIDKSVPPEKVTIEDTADNP